MGRAHQMWLKRSIVTLKIMRPAAYDAYEASTIIHSRPGSEIVSWRVDGGRDTLSNIYLTIVVVGGKEHETGGT